MSTTQRRKCHSVPTHLSDRHGRFTAEHSKISTLETHNSLLRKGNLCFENK